MLCEIQTSVHPRSPYVGQVIDIREVRTEKGEDGKEVEAIYSLKGRPMGWGSLELDSRYFTLERKELTLDAAMEIWKTAKAHVNETIASEVEIALDSASDDALVNEILSRKFEPTFAQEMAAIGITISADGKVVPIAEEVGGG